MSCFYASQGPSVLALYCSAYLLQTHYSSCFRIISYGSIALRFHNYCFNSQKMFRGYNQFILTANLRKRLPEQLKTIFFYKLADVI